MYITEKIWVHTTYSYGSMHERMIGNGPDTMKISSSKEEDIWIKDNIRPLILFLMWVGLKWASGEGKKIHGAKTNWKR